jgi:AraC-like DNA-binding protein
MISGLKNLAYISWGVRTYGEKPVLPRLRERWEFQFIFEGKARPTEVECSLPEEGRSRFYVSHPRSPHGWTDEKGGVSEVFVVQYLEVPDELAGQVGPAKPIVVELDEAAVERMVRRGEEARRAVAAGDVQGSLFFQRLLMELTTLALSRAVDQARKVDATDKVARAMNWFEENVAGVPTVEEAARAAGVSAAHLRRLFAEAGRPSPQAELARLRMDAAKRCLRDGWTQKAVAELLGFSEPSAFARAFRDYEGVPPGAWREKQVTA